MSLWYVLVEGREEGPFTAEQMRQLAGEGRLKPLSRVRRSDMARDISARRLKGLFSDEAIARALESRRARRASTANSARFFVEAADGEQGPLTLAQLRARAAAGTLGAESRVRQDGVQGTVSAKRITGLFSRDDARGRGLGQAGSPLGFYIVAGAMEHGPYMLAELKSLLADGVIDRDTRVRREDRAGPGADIAVATLIPAESGPRTAPGGAAGGAVAT